MKLKLDENLPHDLATELAARGYDVHTVVDEQLAGQSDPVVVRAAASEDRMVLTFDRGVGDLRHYPPGSHAGIVVLRPASQDPATVLELVERLPCWAAKAARIPSTVSTWRFTPSTSFIRLRRSRSTGAKGARTVAEATVDDHNTGHERDPAPCGGQGPFLGGHRPSRHDP